MKRSNMAVPSLRRESVLAVLFGLFLVGVVLVCIGFVDRSVSSWMVAHFHPERSWFDVPTHLVDPLLPLAAMGLLARLISGRMQWHGRPLGRSLVLACLAVAVAVLVKEQAKYAFGRLWPETWVEKNPSWIGTGQYGFFPFHGGRGWASFPSGHMTVITAPATVFWSALPPLRPLVAVVCLAVALGLLGADYHFVSDIVSGTALGMGCGCAVLSVASQREAPMDRSPVSTGAVSPSQVASGLG